ncbi:MAG: precorrin-8X methylmutase [Clostridia bacterium]|jgi:precorrin-8X/cobalt-precorrin-8 methylmutase|nr:precorrin-8X methylmutase [Clostridia bacterium]
MTKYMNDPMGIETKSFEIIGEELPQHGEFSFDEQQMLVVKRMIHTTADFDYASLVEFKDEPVARALEALQSGCKIYADTNMIKAGINKRKLKQFGCEIVNFVADDDVREQAKAQGVTRSTISMHKACMDKDIKIFAIGNAPTALFTLLELVESGQAAPDVIIGVPVGFVGAAESKEQLLAADVPSISVQGRKGGSTVTVSILNALFYIIDNNR